VPQFPLRRGSESHRLAAGEATARLDESSNTTVSRSTTGLLEQMRRSEDRRASAWRAPIASRQLHGTTTSGSPGMWL